MFTKLWRKRGAEKRSTLYHQTNTPANLQAILVELSQPIRSYLEMDRRINLCKQALASVHLEDNPELWGWLQDTLGSSFAGNPHGSKAENIEQAIDHYQQALKVRNRQVFPKRWAITQNNLGGAFLYRIRGERAENIEQAIVHFQQALEVSTRQAFSERWAGVQNNLGEAYRNRIIGKRLDNIEQAIKHYYQALEVRTKRAFPVDWAMTQNNLAMVYWQRVDGDRAENLEQAIAFYQQTLEVYTRESFPEQWGWTLMNLGIAFSDRIRGERSKNLEQAIEHYQQTLEVYTQEAYPHEWATIQNNLGTVFFDRIKGERLENIEQAVSYYQRTLGVRTQQELPKQWAETQNNLVNAYRVRTDGIRAENLEQAIEYYQQALRVLTQHAFPEQWAMIQYNQGEAYRLRITGERAQNIEKAIKHAQRAAEVYTRQGFPEQWAAIQNNIALAYADRIEGDPAENLEQAIAYYHQALVVYTRQAYPELWAGTQNNLALVYADRIKGDPAENLEQAIACFQQALTVRTLEQYPIDYQIIQRSLGNLYFDIADWESSLTAYQKAIRAEKVLLESAYTSMGRQAETAETSRLYTRAAYAFLKLGKIGKALEQLEQGKTRLLAQSLSLHEVDLSILPTEQQELIRRLREEISQLEWEARRPMGAPGRRDDRALAMQLKQIRDRLYQEIKTIRAEHPDFMPSELKLTEILALIQPEAAMVAPLITSQGSVVFVIPGGTQTVSLDHVIWLKGFKEEDLHALLMGTHKEAEMGGWLGAYFNKAESTQAWFQSIETIGNKLWCNLLEPTHVRLATLGIKNVLLIPQGGLGILPLHAAWREVDGAKQYFLDDYVVTYVPSAFLLGISQQRLRDEQRHQHSLFAVVNPTQDLSFTPVEGEQVAKIFGETHADLLQEDKATLDAVKTGIRGHNYLHFSCHGFYNWQYPMQSGLVLANKEHLTLAAIIHDFKLGTSRLVTLSACETGITEMRQSPDEYLGLPAGFLQAGAPGVVSTLWAVNDLSTMLLMERFYQLHLQDGLEIATALRQAQIWLKNATAGELAAHFEAEEETALNKVRMPIETASAQYRRFTEFPEQLRPFEHPYFWAAFTFSGA